MKFAHFFPSSTHIIIFLILYNTSICLTSENKKIEKIMLTNLKANEKQFYSSNISAVPSNCACAQTIPKCCTPEYFKVIIANLIIITS